MKTVAMVFCFAMCAIISECGVAAEEPDDIINVLAPDNSPQEFKVRKRAKVVTKANDLEELLGLIQTGREEIVVGFFDPPLVNQLNDDGEQEEVRKASSDAKYQWWHKISMNEYNSEMSFVVVSDASVAHYFGMFPMPNKPAPLYFVEDGPSYIVYRPNFFEDGQMHFDPEDESKKIGMLVEDIFQIGGWKLVPTKKHAKMIEMLNAHLATLKDEL